MKAGEIEKLQTSSVSRVLEGTVSGVQASASSGQPGTDAEIRIRGIGSINASSAPLYVVDGVPFDGSVNSINPDDIASMTVLKDAASAGSVRFAWCERCDYHYHKAGTAGLESYCQGESYTGWFQSCGT